MSEDKEGVKPKYYFVFSYPYEVLSVRIRSPDCISFKKLATRTQKMSKSEGYVQSASG